MWIIQTYNCCLHPLSLETCTRKQFWFKVGNCGAQCQKDLLLAAYSCTIWIFFFFTFYHVYIFLSKNKNFNAIKSGKKKVHIIYPSYSTATLSKLEM